MQEMAQMGVRKAQVTVALVIAVALAAVPAVGLTAQASALEATAPATASAATQVTTQATSIDKAAVKTAKAVVKKAKATKGKDAAKLKKIYTYIAQDASNGGVYQIEQLPYFYFKYGSKYYSASTTKVKTTLLKQYYKKYATDMQEAKKGSCFHYAALFGVAAKQALGKKATVKVVAGSSKHTGELNPSHAWTEIKLGKKTYVYDTQAGNNYSKSDAATSATDFGPYCGSLKSALKANYDNYKGAKYVTVKL